MNTQALCVFVILAAVAVLAQTPTPTPDQNQRLSADRQVSFTLTSTDVLFQSQTASPVDRNRLQVEYQASPNNQFNIETRVWTDTDTSSTGFKFNVRFNRIIEYFETDGTPGFNLLGNDTLSSNHPYNIGHLTCTQDANTTDANGNIIMNFHCQTPETVPVFKVIGYVATVQTTIAEQVVLPSSHKFDLVITPNWVPMAGSRIALTVFIDADSSAGFHPSNSSAAVDRDDVTTVHLGSATLPTAQFGWVPDITVNGNTSANIIVGPLCDPNAVAQGPNPPPQDPNTNRQIMAFSFDVIAPLSITWDPSVSMDVGAVSSSTSGAAAAASSMLALAVALTSVLAALLA